MVFDIKILNEDNINNLFCCSWQSYFHLLKNAAWGGKCINRMNTLTRDDPERHLQWEHGIQWGSHSSEDSLYLCLSLQHFFSSALRLASQLAFRIFPWWLQQHYMFLLFRLFLRPSYITCPLFLFLTPSLALLIGLLLVFHWILLFLRPENFLIAVIKFDIIFMYNELQQIIKYQLAITIITVCEGALWIIPYFLCFCWLMDDIRQYQQQIIDIASPPRVRSVFE